MDVIFPRYSLSDTFYGPMYHISSQYFHFLHYCMMNSKQLRVPFLFCKVILQQKKWVSGFSFLGLCFMSDKVCLLRCIVKEWLDFRPV